MEFWLITSLIAIWIFLSATVLVSVCMLSSRLSRQEELQAGGRTHELAARAYSDHAQAAERSFRASGDMIELPAGLGNQ
jgi:hypothetical protein